MTKYTLLSVVIVVLFCIAALRFFLSMAKGDKAIAKMNAEEKRFLKKIQQIKAGDTYESVKTILGVPDRGAGTPRPTWKVLNSEGKSQVAVYLTNAETVRKVTWMKMGQFIWEH